MMFVEIEVTDEIMRKELRQLYNSIKEENNSIKEGNINKVALEDYVFNMQLLSAIAVVHNYYAVPTEWIDV